MKGQFVINDRFSFDYDEYNWILYDTKKYKSKKTGEIKESIKTWYPSTLAFLCEWVISETPKKSGSIPEVLNAILQAKQECIEAIKLIPYRHTDKNIE
jgi:hypothetical protein